MAARKLAPTLQQELLGERPYVLNPLFQTVQRLFVSVPGEEPDLTASNLAENNTLLGGVFAEKSIGWMERKKYFASEKHGRRTRTPHAATPASFPQLFAPARHVPCARAVAWPPSPDRLH